GVLERHPAPAVPHDHGAGPVVALGDDAFEVAVLERMVLHVDGETLVGPVGRGALRNGPGPEHAVRLEAQVPMEPPGGVQMADEQAAGRRGGSGGTRSW